LDKEGVLKQWDIMQQKLYKDYGESDLVFTKGCLIKSGNLSFGDEFLEWLDIDFEQML